MRMPQPSQLLRARSLQLQPCTRSRRPSPPLPLLSRRRLQQPLPVLLLPVAAAISSRPSLSFSVPPTLLRPLAPSWRAFAPRTPKRSRASRSTTSKCWPRAWPRQTSQEQQSSSNNSHNNSRRNPPQQQSHKQSSCKWIEIEHQPAQHAGTALSRSSRSFASDTEASDCCFFSFFCIFVSTSERQARGSKGS